MTIIAPKKNKNNINLIIIGLVLPVLVLAYWSISIYNQTVNLKHVLDDSRNQIQELKVTNADLKNQLYQLTDSRNLIQLGEDKGLVRVEGIWSTVSVLR